MGKGCRPEDASGISIHIAKRLVTFREFQMIKDKLFRQMPLLLAVTGGVVGIHNLMQEGNTNLSDYCRVFWLAWVILLWARVMREFVVILKRGESLTHPSVLEPIVLIPLSLFPVDVIGRNAAELSIEPLLVCVVTAGLIVMGAIRLSELALSRICDPLMGLIFRTFRKVVNRRYSRKVPVICRRCVYCTARKHLLCAIRPLGPEHPNNCSSFVAKDNEEVL